MEESVVRYINRILRDEYRNSKETLREINADAHLYLFTGVSDSGNDITFGDLIYERCKIEGHEDDPSAWIPILGGTRANDESVKFEDFILDLLDKGKEWDRKNPFPGQKYNAIYNFYVENEGLNNLLSTISMKEYMLFIVQCEGLMRGCVGKYIGRMSDIITQYKERWRRLPANLQEACDLLRKAVKGNRRRRIMIEEVICRALHITLILVKKKCLLNRGVL